MGYCKVQDNKTNGTLTRLARAGALRSILLIIGNMLLLLVLSIRICYPQNQGFELIIETEGGSTLSDAAEDSYGNIIFCGAENVLGSQNISAFAIKLTPTGDYLFKNFVFQDDTLCYLLKVIILPDNEYIFFGTIGTPDSSLLQRRTKFLWMIKMNENLELIWDKRFELPGDYWNPGFVVWLNNNETIYAAGNCDWYWEGNHRVNFFMAKFNINGDTIRTRYPFINDPMQYPLGGVYGGCMGRHYNQEGMMVVGDGFIVGEDKGIIEIDSALNYTFTPINSGNFVMTEVSNIKHLSPTTYLLSSDIHVVFQSETDQNVARLNQNHHFVDNIVYGRIDTIDFPAPFKSLDFTDVQNIFVVGRDNVFPYNNKNTQVSIALVDSSLNMKGLKYYSGNMNYMCTAVTATTDGGCIISGSAYDWQNNPPEDVNVWIKKVFPEDIITDAEDTPDPSDSDIILYPNPGSDQITIKTFRQNLVFKLKTMDGKDILEEDIKNIPLQKFNTHHLSVGSYNYQVWDEFKKTIIDSGVWIKN